VAERNTTLRTSATSRRPFGSSKPLARPPLGLTQETAKEIRADPASYPTHPLARPPPPSPPSPLKPRRERPVAKPPVPCFGAAAARAEPVRRTHEMPSFSRAVRPASAPTRATAPLSPIWLPLQLGGRGKGSGSVGLTR
jgi:hypothetical protein